MTCSACGEPNPADYRFCGMCGSRLSHRGLASQDTRDGPITHPSPDTGGQAPVFVETLRDQPSRPFDFPRERRPASEDALQVFSDSLDDPQLERSEEMATIGETLALPSEVLAIADALPAVESSPQGEVAHFEWMDDVLEEIEIEAAKSSSEHSDPQFPDLLDELSLPSFETTPDPNNAPQPSHEVRASPTKTSRRWSGRDVRWGNKWGMLLGAAAILVFAVLGALQWRSYRNDSDGPVEFVLSKIQELMPGYREESATLADSEANNSNPPIHTEEQTKPQDRRATSLPAGSTQATAAQPAPQSAPSTADKTEPPQRPAQGKEQQAAVSTQVPGAAEMTKARQASDAAAQAAWLWKATAKGNPDAPLRLADMYIKGEGVPRSCEQAVVLLKTSAINQSARACDRLASMYATGTCVQRNPVKAYRWLSSALAADPHSEWARQNRDLTWQQMTPEERTLAEKYR